MPHGLLHHGASALEPTMIYDANEHPFDEFESNPFLLFASHIDRARFIYKYIFTRKPMSNQYIYQNERIIRLGDGRSTA